jgi:hypothetical protein
MIMTTLCRPVALALALLAAAGCSAGEPSEAPPAGSFDLPQQERVASPSGEGEGEANGAEPSAGTTPATTQEFELPTWQRKDVQPKSDRFGTSYGLEAYEGRTVVVILLEGYCSFCQSNSLVAQALRDELVAEKLDVEIVILGDPNAEQFASKVALPIFEDPDKSAWNEMRAGAYKHDTFVFAPNGERTYFWPGSYQGDATRWLADIGKAVRAVAKTTGS